MEKKKTDNVVSHFCIRALGEASIQTTCTYGVNCCMGRCCLTANWNLDVLGLLLLYPLKEETQKIFFLLFPCFACVLCIALVALHP